MINDRLGHHAIAHSQF